MRSLPHSPRRRSLIVPLLSALLFGSVAFARDAAADNETFLSFESSGDWIGQGIKRTFTASDGKFSSVSMSAAQGLTIKFEQPSGIYYHLEFDAPGPTELKTNQFSGIQRYPFNGTLPGFAITTNGRGCNQVLGDFTVFNAVFNPNGSVRSFGASFNHYCESIDPRNKLSGTIMYNVPRPAPDAVITGVKAWASSAYSTTFKAANMVDAEPYTSWAGAFRAGSWTTSFTLPGSYNLASLEFTYLADRYYSARQANAHLFNGSQEVAVVNMPLSRIYGQQTARIPLPRGKTVTRVEIRMVDSEIFMPLIRNVKFIGAKFMSPWCNMDNRFDASGDGVLAPDDLLTLINAMNAGVSGQLPAERSYRQGFLDIDNDGHLSPSDMLGLLSHYNAQ